MKFPCRRRPQKNVSPHKREVRGRKPLKSEPLRPRKQVESSQKEEADDANCGKNEKLARKWLAIWTSSAHTQRHHVFYFGAKEQMLNLCPTLTSPKQTPCFVHLVTYLRRNLFTATCFVLRRLCCLYKCLRCTKWSQSCIASQRGAKGNEALFTKVEPAGLVGFFFAAADRDFRLD